MAKIVQLPPPEPVRLPGTNVDLGEVMKVLNPAVHVGLTQEEGYDAYNLRVSWLGYVNVSLSGQQITNTQLVVEELDAAVRELEAYARTTLGLEPAISAAVERANSRWEQQVAPILMAAGVAPQTARTIINDIKENVK